MGYKKREKPEKTESYVIKNGWIWEELGVICHQNIFYTILKELIKVYSTRKCGSINFG